jgi:hypothetical protein
MCFTFWLWERENENKAFGWLEQEQGKEGKRRRMGANRCNVYQSLEDLPYYMHLPDFFFPSEDGYFGGLWGMVIVMGSSLSSLSSEIGI